eukprot:gnl/MRDRNA2_/MRDRNA2_89115_c0_seq1.p1 gnl/MRDRNA2_/MRDRNA2_89115_c0~~gnl/MRDRNA2_/MRDRNA2_89115_c0_seq1.p1  ORF type:complete len:235 (+),score=40.67 gnl/MRDRNA2_/MRDRNA2_89115_c0_seq1:39-743(+)
MALREELLAPPSRNHADILETLLATQQGATGSLRWDDGRRRRCRCCRCCLRPSRPSLRSHSSLPSLPELRQSCTSLSSLTNAASSMLQSKQMPDAVGGMLDPHVDQHQRLTATSFASDLQPVHASNLQLASGCPGHQEEVLNGVRRPSAISSNGSHTPTAHVQKGPGKWVIKRGQWYLENGPKYGSLQEQVKAYQAMLEKTSKQKRYENGIAQGGNMRRFQQRNPYGGFWAMGA